MGVAQIRVPVRSWVGQNKLPNWARSEYRNQRWFEDVTTTLVGALLERWPNLEELKRAHPGTLRRFFHQHHCRSEDLIRERIDAIQSRDLGDHRRSLIGSRCHDGPRISRDNKHAPPHYQ